jgi:hypothetical protein
MVNVHANGMAYCLLKAAWSFEILIHIHFLRSRGRSLTSPDAMVHYAIIIRDRCEIVAVSQRYADARPWERMKLGAVLVAYEPSV